MRASLVGNCVADCVLVRPSFLPCIRIEIETEGLGFVDALICPHYDVEKHRKPSLKAMMKKHAGVAIALDEYCALIVQDDAYRILASVKGRKAYRVYWKNGEYREEQLLPSKLFKPLAPLLAK